MLNIAPFGDPFGHQHLLKIVAWRPGRPLERPREHFERFGEHFLILFEPLGSILATSSEDVGAQI